MLHIAEKSKLLQTICEGRAMPIHLLVQFLENSAIFLKNYYLISSKNLNFPFFFFFFLQNVIINILVAT